MSKCLIMFDEYGPKMGLPSMKDSFEKVPYEGINTIVSYLKNGRKTYAAASRAYDFFTGEVIPEENCGMTDGEYTWSGSLAHYVEKYNLRLPKDFEEHVFAKL